jgi:hypothetical protein
MCICQLDTYPCKFSRNNITIRDLQRKEKAELFYTGNSIHVLLILQYNGKYPNAHAPGFINFEKIAIWIFFHVYIMLIFRCVSFHGTIRLYVVYTKMTKYLNDTIMIGCALFTEIGNYIFTFMCGSYMANFLCRNLHKQEST